MTAHKSDCYNCKHAELLVAPTMLTCYTQPQLTIYCNHIKKIHITPYEKCIHQEKRHTWRD